MLARSTSVKTAPKPLTVAGLRAGHEEPDAHHVGGDRREQLLRAERREDVVVLPVDVREPDARVGRVVGVGAHLELVVLRHEHRTARDGGVEEVRRQQVRGRLRVRRPVPVDFPTAGGGGRVAGVVGFPEQTAERGHGGRDPAAPPAAPSILVNANADGAADAGEPSGSTIAETAAASTNTATRTPHLPVPGHGKAFLFNGFSGRGPALGRRGRLDPT